MTRRPVRVHAIEEEEKEKEEEGDRKGTNVT